MVIASDPRRARREYLKRKGNRRTFGGKRYKFASWQGTKREAEDIKEFHQTRGWKVRLVKDGGGYSIYIRG